MIQMEQDLSKKVARFVYDKRIALGMNQRQFAEHVFGHKKHQHWVSHIENGRGISVDTLGKILDKLDANIEFVEY